MSHPRRNFRFLLSLSFKVALIWDSGGGQFYGGTESILDVTDAEAMMAKHILVLKDVSR